MAYIDINHSNPLPFIRIGDRAFCHQDWSWDSRTQMHWKGFNLWYIAGGTGTLIADNQHYVLSPGDCFLLRMWEHHQGANQSSETLNIPWVVFNYHDKDGKSLTPGHIRALPPRYRRISNISFFNDIFQRIIDAHKSGNIPSALFWLEAALKEMADEDERRTKRARPQAQVQKINLLCGEIQENPAAPYDIGRLARKAGYSVDHFIRIFRGIKNTTPMEFIIQSRLNAAGNLLLFSTHSIAEISDKLGYSDQFSFSRQFKTKMGMSPAQYRVKHLA